MPYRDPLRQYQQASAEFIETADSVGRARDYQRRQRAAHLESLLVTEPDLFDLMFRTFYAQDEAIVLVLSDAAAARGLALVNTGRQQ